MSIVVVVSTAVAVAVAAVLCHRLRILARIQTTLSLLVQGVALALMVLLQA